MCRATHLTNHLKIVSKIHGMLWWKLSLKFLRLKPMLSRILKGMRITLFTSLQVSLSQCQENDSIKYRTPESGRKDSLSLKALAVVCISGYLS